MCDVVLEVQQSLMLTLFSVFHVLLRQVWKGCAMGASASPMTCGSTCYGLKRHRFVSSFFMCRVTLNRDNNVFLFYNNI